MCRKMGERHLSLNKKFSVGTVSFRLRGPDTTNQAGICGCGVDLRREQDQKEVCEEAVIWGLVSCELWSLRKKKNSHETKQRKPRKLFTGNDKQTQDSGKTSQSP